MKKLLLLIGLLFTTNAVADNNTNCTNSQDCYNSGVYIYEGGQDLIDLYTMSGTTNLNSGDDWWSGQVSLGMEWDRWGQTWSHAKMSTNGCVNLISGSAGGSSGNCGDYTPQSLPYRDYTLYPLWTDLIRGTASGGQSSKMLFKDFGDYVVFGWYYLREYQRSSSNSFEAILYANNSYEYRYRELDIIQHDVVIGEQGKHSTNPEDTKTFLYYNDNQSGYNTLDAYLANSGWPDIENGGSLFGGTEAQMCELDALYSSSCSGYAAAYLAQQCAISSLHSSSCSGYAAAYLAQQCGLNTLYSESCTGYAAAYLAQQCGLNTLYSESCTGYAVAFFLYECNIDVFYSSSCSGYSAALAQEQALQDAIYGTDDESYGYDDGYDEYGNEDSQYGYDDSGNAYTEEDMWYDEEYDEYLDPNDPCYQNACENFTDADWYALDVEQFGQENVDEWYGSEVEFSEEGFVDYGTSTEEEYWTNIDEGMDEYDAEQEATWAAEELAWQEEEQRYYEEEQARILAEEMYAQEEEMYAQEEEMYATLETDADWYAYEVEEFGQENVDEWYGSDVEFTEEGFVEESYFEEAYSEELYSEEFYEVEVTEEAQLIAQNLTDHEIYILEEEVGVEIFVEEEWEPVEENEIYDEELEDFEVEALEEHEDEIFEEFDEEYEDEEIYLEEDEAFEDLIDEEELDELINEEDEKEFFQPESEGSSQEETKQIYAGPTSSGQKSSEFKQEQQTFTVMIAQQEQQEQQTIQQAVSQDSSSSSSQAAIAEIDFGGTQEEQQTVAEVIQEQLDDGSGSSTGGSFDSNSYSSGSSSSGSSGFVASSSQQEQITQSTGDTFVAQQQEQVSGQVQTQIQVTEVIDSGPVISAFEVAEQQQETQEEQQELTFDDGSNFTVADQNFESSFDDALGTGQSIGQFLSNQAPNFAKFDIPPPTVQEQQVTTAVESLADRMGTQVAAQNLQVQLDSVQQGGGFDVDQTATVAFIGYSSGFSDYAGQEQLSDRDEWYISKTMYKGNDNKDADLSFYMMAGRTEGKMREMIRSQYE
jgi:hypothetical protein